MSAAALSLEGVFALFASRFGGEAERLGEGDMARLIEAARGGDPGARRRLYTQHVDLVFRTVRGLLRSDAEAEDVTQDALMAVLTSLHRYAPREGASFSTWVVTIGINTARRRYRRRRPELTRDGDLPDIADDAPDPGEAIDAARRRRALLTALAELSERERSLVSLRYGAELNASQIAAALRLEPAAVRKALERARDRLAARIDALLTPAEARP